MNDINGRGIASLASARSVAETANRLAAALQSAGMTIFARLDQQAAAKAVGLDMRPMVLLIFGNPAAGTPLMIAHPTLAIDLPLKALVWEDADGKVHVDYNSPDYLQRRHGLPQRPFEPIGNVIAQALRLPSGTTAQAIT